MIHIHMVVTAKGGLIVVAHAVGSRAYAQSRRSTEMCLWVDLAGRCFPVAVTQEPAGNLPELSGDTEPLIVHPLHLEMAYH